MVPFPSTVQDVSICLRCQYRLATRRLFRRKPLDGTRYPVSSRFSSSAQNGAPHQLDPDDLVVHDAQSVSKHTGDVSSYSSYRPGRNIWRHADLHIKDPLGFDALGRPAEILVLRNELQKALVKRGEKANPGRADITVNNQASSDELLASIDAERGIIGADRVLANIESLRDSWVSNLGDRFGTPTPSEVENLSRKLRDGFTTEQLLQYFHGGSPSGPMEIDYDFTSQRYKWSAWTPGRTSFPGNASSRLRSLKTVGDNSNTASRGGVLMERTKRRPIKQIVVDKIMRQLWRLQTEQEKELLGELDVWIQPEHLDLVLNHSKQAGSVLLV